MEQTNQPITAPVIPPQGGALATLPPNINYAEYEGVGSTIGRDIPQNHLVIPSIVILQSDSPFCKKSNKETYIQGCEDGNFFNLSTHEQYEGQNTGINIVPCYWFTDFEERETTTDKKNRGQLIGIHKSGSDTHRSARWVNRHYVTPDGNAMIERRNLFCQLVASPTQDIFFRVLIRFKNRNIKTYDMLMSQIDNWRLRINDGRLIKPACFHGIYNLRITETKNEDNSWWILKLNSSESTEEGKKRVFQTLVVNKDLIDDSYSFRTSMEEGAKYTEEDPDYENNAAGEPETTDIPF